MRQYTFVKIFQHAVLGCFALAALPVLATLPPLQKNPAVLPLPFISRGYSQAWILGESQSIITPSPSFQLFDSRARGLVDNNSHVLVLVENKDNYAFAHEAPVYFSDSDQLYFCSDAGGKTGRSNSTTNNRVFQIKVQDIIKRARQGKSSFEEDVHPVEINSDSVQMTNGGTPYQNQLLLANDGRTETYAPSLALVDRSNTTRVMPLLNNVAGKQFGSMNDVKVNTRTGSIYFTDTNYGVNKGYRPPVDLPKATWRFDPRTGRLSMLDASLVTPNGIAISKDGKTLYITETGSTRAGNLSVEANVPSVMYVIAKDQYRRDWVTDTISRSYAFDVIHKPDTEYVQNKRLFAFVPTIIGELYYLESAF
jgi:sugar lactone lactonase YvrE